MLLLLGWSTGQAAATTVMYRTDAQLVALSDRVVHGRVLDVRTEVDPVTRSIHTIARIAVLEDFTGINESIIEVRELGGTIGATRLWIAGAVRYTPGDELVLCLTQHAGRWQSTALSFSAFHVEPAVQGGAAVLRRDTTQVNVLAAPAQPLDVRSLDAFRQTVMQVKGTQPVTPVQAPDAGAPVVRGFALLDPPMRWMKSDSGGTVMWYRNPSAPPPPGPSDIDATIVTALHAWTDPLDASVTLSYGGTRTIGSADPTSCNPLPAPGVGIISFEDPTNELTSPTIAIGGGCSDSSSTKVINGTTFQGFTYGLVIFNNAAELTADVKTATNILRVMTHEIGHAIGLDHTDVSNPPVANPKSNLMYSACCYDTQPIPPAIGPDDHAGLMFIYPPDLDNDGLPDWWELQYGLSNTDATGDNGPNGDPDHDGVTNLQEYQNGTHPNGVVKRYLAEGVVNEFFDTQLALLNPGDVTARVLVRLQTDQGTEKSTYLAINPHTRATITSATLRSLTTGSFATLVESDQLVIVDRTVSWGGGYGSSGETAVESPSLTWYLAEGATGGPFDVFYLLQNPNTVPVKAQVTYLRLGGQTPLVKLYDVPAKGRLTIWVDDQNFPDPSGPKLLASAEVSGVIKVTNAAGTPCDSVSPAPAECQPIIVERSMYLSQPGQPFAAGHDAAGVTAPKHHWFLAEGATGNFFDTYVLLANPNPAPTTVHVTYLIAGGQPITKDYALAANSRYTIYVNQEEIPTGSGQHPLSAVTLSTRLDVDDTNPPIVVERAMWWPNGNWYEAHDVAGSIVTGTKWALAEGEQGGANNTHTYVLIANVDSADATVTVKAMLEDGTVVTSPVPFTIPARSRSTVEIADGPFFSGVGNKRFGVVVESVNGQQIVVEHSMYSDFAGQFWAAGTAALGSCLQCSAAANETSR